MLLVDDEGSARRMLRQLLEAEGIAVVGEAGNGFEAVDLAMALEPDVALMDLRMPDMGGLEAARLLRQSLPFIQVIVLTAYDGPLPARSAEEAGVYAYLVKGCSIQLMRDVIEQEWHYNAGLKRQAGTRRRTGTLPPRKRPLPEAVINETARRVLELVRAGEGRPSDP